MVFLMPSSSDTLGSHPSLFFALFISRQSFVCMLGFVRSCSILRFFPDMSTIFLTKFFTEIEFPTPTLKISNFFSCPFIARSTKSTRSEIYNKSLVLVRLSVVDDFEAGDVGELKISVENTANVPDG